MFTLTHRVRVVAVAMFCAMTTFASHRASAQDWHWTGAAGGPAWSNAANWSPFGVPPETALVGIGTLAGFEALSTVLDANEAIAGLRVETGSSFSTGGNILAVFGDTYVVGRDVPIMGVGTPFTRSVLEVQRIGFDFFDTEDLVLEAGHLRLTTDGTVRILGNMSLDDRSIVSGAGSISFRGPGTNFRNDGEIIVGSLVSNSITSMDLVQQNVAGRFDLDGLGEQGSIRLDRYYPALAQGTRLTVQGTGLADSFSGTIEMTTDSRFMPNLAEGFHADASSVINVDGFSPVGGAPALISGGPIDFDGTLTVSDPGSSLEIRSTLITMGAGAHVNVRDGSSALIGFDAPGSTSGVTVEGGDFTVEDGGTLEFDSTITMRGGTFSTPSEDAAEGRVVFTGESDWFGAFEFSGYATIDGAATVSSSTTINADRLDMDGPAGQNTWQIEAGVVVNARTLDSNGLDTMNADVTIAGGLGSNLTVHTEDGTWSSSGDFTLVGNAFPLERISGDSLFYSGTLTLASNRAAIGADIVLGPSSDMILSSSNAELHLNGESTLLNGVAFMGNGTLVNAGEMTLRNGITLDTVGLRNDGLLRIGNDDIPTAEIGTALVHAFENTAAGSWLVSIGGEAPGSQYDRLFVTGGDVVLGGEILVDLVDLGGGVFLPSVGDEFTVLTSLSTLTGTFANNPVSEAGGWTFFWSVEHRPNTVVLRLDAVVVPAPGSLALMSLALVAVRRKRSGR